MGAASFVQSSFLGGVWSRFFQGRMDHPRYSTAMAQCMNGFPVEEGAWVRRPGWRFVANTRANALARLMPYNFSQATPYNIELTSTHARLVSGYSLVFQEGFVRTVSSISTATPAVVTTSAPHGMTTGREVQFIFAYPASVNNPTICATLKNRQFILTSTGASTFSIADSISGTAVDGSTINFDGATVTTQVGMLIDMTTPYTSTTYRECTLVQNEESAVLLHPDFAPQEVTITPDASVTAYDVATATWEEANIKDGPYYDLVGGGAFLYPTTVDPDQPNVVSLTIAFPDYDADTPYNLGDLVQNMDGAFRSLQDSNLGNNPATSAAYWEEVDAGIVNGPDGFTSADIGRHVRLYSIPIEWNPATTYAQGDTVTWNDGFYVSQRDDNVGVTPDTNAGAPNNTTNSWLPTVSEGVARWTWGKITAIGTGTDPRMVINVYGLPLVDDHTATPGVKIFQWRLGLYGGGGGVGYPSCGVYHEGRLWLSGSELAPNRFDASCSNDFLNFAPTSVEGTVADNSAISAVLNASEANPLRWMVSTDQGILCGSAGGEWRIQASNQNDPLTPTTVQAKRTTKYGCANVQPVQAGIAVLFVQKYARAIYEMMLELFSNRTIAQNLCISAKEISASTTFAEIAYQAELVPVVWARMFNGNLTGCTYRRMSPTASEEPSFYAWHEHTHGTGASFLSIAVGPSDIAAIDMLSAVTARTSFTAIEYMTPLFDVNASYTQAWHLDGATSAAGAVVATEGGSQGIRIYGLWPHNGRSPTFYLGGIDCGTYAVTNGSAFVPFGTYDGKAVNLAYIQAVDAAFDAGELEMGNAENVVVNGSTPYTFSIVVGYEYTSTGQILRPQSSRDTGAQNGPGFGKTRRIHQFAAQLHNTVAGKISFGTATAKLYPALMKSPGGTSYTPDQLYSGVFQTTLEDDYGYDGQIMWECANPYPASVLAVGGFIQTQDR
jgi:hypothetical protein